MKRFNMKTLSLISSLSSLALLMACGDNVTDNDPVTTQAYASQEEFPECEESSEGYFALVSSTNDLYICSAKEWVNISNASAGSSAKPGCSSEELEDGTGVKIICNGDSVATLNYGKQGATGSKGEDGHKGKTGEKGEPGSSTNGKDAVWDTDRCKLKNSGFDVMVYDCGDSVYVSGLPLTGGNTNNVWKPWPNVSLTYFSGGNTLVIFNKPTGSEATGTLERYDGDNSWIGGALTTDDLYRDDFQVKGTATVKLTKAEAVSASYYRPSVGMAFGIPTANKNLGPSMGLCLTYSSEKDMALLVKGETGFIKASVPATKNKVKIINVPWEDFEPVVKEVDAEKVIKAANLIFVEAVGGDTAGTYTNEFSIAQVGDFGNCDGNTYANSPWKAYVENLATPATGFTLGGVTYKAIKIGNLTWMTENMRYAPNSESCYSSSDATGCPTYGRIYTWAQAKAVCEAAGTGWRLPTVTEWGNLFYTVRQNFEIDTDPKYKIANKLALNAEGVYNGKNLSGMNLKAPSSINLITYWTSTTYSSTMSRVASYYQKDAYPYIYQGTDASYPITSTSYTGDFWGTDNTYLVRCVKD